MPAFARDQRAHHARHDAWLVAMLYGRVHEMRIWLLPLLVIACGKGADPRGRTASTGSAAVETPAAPRSRVAALVERLRSKDEEDRRKALDELQPRSFSGEDALDLLRASALDYGDRADSPFPTAAELVLAVKPDSRVTPLVEQLFPRWPAAAKAAGLDLISRIDDEPSTKTFVRLLPSCPTDQIGFALRGIRTALSNRDPRLVFFAAKSLRALGRDVPADAVARIAASAEMRNWLIQELAKTHELSIIPARYRSQAAIAESEMVQWLTFPTELGHVPDAIELARILSVDSEDGPVDLFVFKFKTDDGWLAGVAGPYARSEEPTTHSLGGTFSAFEPWSAKTPEQHAAALSDLIDKARTQRVRTGRDEASVPDSDARDRAQRSGAHR